MPDSPELQAAKHDGGFLRSILKIERDGQHCKCPICGHSGMRVGPDKSGSGVYMWQCMKECGAGTVVDALMKVERKTLSEAISLCEQQFGGGKKPYHRNGAVPMQHARTASQAAQAKRDEEDKKKHDELYRVYAEPVINLDVANAFIERALNNLIERRDLQEKWLTKRQISLDVCKQYRVGFLDKFDVHCLGYDGKNDWDWRVTNGWVLPLTDQNGVLKSVKIHFEKQDGKEIKGKSTWMQFGTVPPHDRVKNVKPIHAYVCLWPHPYQQKKIKRFKKSERDQNWWISQAPEELREKYVQLELVEKFDIAKALKCDWTDIPIEALLQAQANAFAKIKPEIMRSVIKQNNPNATEVRVDQIIAELSVDDCFFIQPGELKALAMISAGMMATSCSEGSPPSVPAFACFRGQNVAIVRDDDEVHTKKDGGYQCTGLTFPLKILERLMPNQPRSVRVLTYGRKDV